MTVSTAYSVLSYAGNGATTAFSVTWPFFEANDLVVTLVASTGVETVQTLTTHYTVSGGTDANGLPATGTVTMLTPPASGETLLIQRATDKTQATTFATNGRFNEKAAEAAFDKLTLLIQEGFGAGGSVLDGRTGDVLSLITSGATDYWDAESHPIKNVTDPTDAQDVVTKAYGDTNYGGAVLTGAVAAQTAAEAAQTAAEAAQTAAEAAFDSFDDVYLGAKASDPTLDNDGDALVEGQFYWNTGTDTLRFYDGSSWSAFTTGSGDMSTGTYDGAGVAEQVVGLTATQTLTNKTLTTPTLVLQDANGSAPTTDGQIKFDRTGENLEVGDGSGTVSFLSEAHYASTANGKGASTIGIEDSGGLYAGTNVEAALTEVVTQGLHTIWIPAKGMTARTTNGAAAGAVELATNDIALSTFDFDQTTEEGVGFHIGMPKSWNEGMVTFIPYWTAASGSGGVVWQMQAVATSNDDALDAAPGTGQTSTDTLIAANDCHIGPTSSAITIGGSPAENDLVYFEITREVANGSDTLTADAKLIGVKILMNLNAATDA